MRCRRVRFCRGCWSCRLRRGRMAVIRRMTANVCVCCGGCVVVIARVDATLSWLEERRLSSSESAVVVERKNASPRPTSFGSADKGDEGKEGQGQATRLLSHTPSSTPSPWVSHDKMLAAPQQTILLSWWDHVNCLSHAENLSLCIHIRESCVHLNLQQHIHKRSTRPEIRSISLGRDRYSR